MSERTFITSEQKHRVPAASQWRHRKTGKEVRVLFLAVQQDSAFPFRDYQVQVVYYEHGAGAGPHWVRSYPEFLTRFTRINHG